MPQDIASILFHAVNQSDTSYLITDKDGRIIFVNSAFERNTGYSFEEVKGKTPSILKSGKHNSEFYQNLYNSIRNGINFKSRIVNKTKNGQLYSVMLSILPVKMDGEIKYYVGREENIDGLIQLESKLIESQKMESLATMTGELAHNFNNLLTVIIGSMDFISEELNDNSTAKKLAIELLKSAKDQAKTIKQLMLFARKQNSLEMKETNLNETLRDILPLIQSQVGSRIKVSFNPIDSIYKVRIDESQIKQAILNITSNSKDAIDGNGEIKILTYKVSNTTEEKEPYHSGNYSVIEIQDDGPGIPESEIQHIFEPFYTTKQKGKGTGLGLSSVYGIVKNHNGYVYASNLKTKGVSFKIYLPAAI